MTPRAEFLVAKENNISEVGAFNLYLGDTLLGSWPCLSGGWGKGPLPLGKYQIKYPRLLVGTPSEKSFKKEAIAWGSDLVPEFKTDRTELMLHPDGGIAGTLGCIGVMQRDTSLLYILKGLMGFKEGVSSIPLEVKIAT